MVTNRFVFWVGEEAVVVFEFGEFEEEEAVVVLAVLGFEGFGDSEVAGEQRLATERILQAALVLEIPIRLLQPGTGQ